MNQPVHILLVEDEPAHATIVKRAFANSDLPAEVSVVKDLAGYRAAIATAPPDIALLDLNLPDGRAVEVLTHPPENGPFPILIMTSFGNEKIAVEAMKAGAIDYVVKSPEAFALLPRTIVRSLREWALICDRRKQEQQREQSLELLRMCNEAGSLADFASRFTAFFQKLAGCRAVGIRLKSDGGYRFFAQQGFSENFLDAENRLCRSNCQAGADTANALAMPFTHCLCGKVIAGAVDVDSPDVTAGGSFWSNHLSLLAAQKEGFSQSELHLNCLRAGYESMAILPLRVGGENYGIFQLCDPAPDFFKPEQILHLESLVAHIAITLAKLQAEESLVETSEFSRQIINSAEEGVVVLGNHLEFKVWNPYMEKLSCLPVSVVLGRRPLEIFPELTDTGFFERVDLALSGNIPAKLDLPLTLLGSGASEGWGSFAFAPLRNSTGEGQGVIVTVQDISLRKRYETELEYRASYDTLTGLANRNLMRDRLQQSIFFAERSDRIVAVMMLDLDRFKTINDSLGHSQGDSLLKLVAQRLEGCVREGDTVSRLGGDEFCLILSEIADDDDVALMANRVQQALAEPFALTGRDLLVSASIGISIFPRDGNDPEVLIREADIAMFRAKEEGRGRIGLFSPEMNTRVLELLDLEAEMRQAIKDKEFTLHYQPKVNIMTGQIEGAEALVRWLNPRRGFISPGKFIPLAEDTGLIVPLGEWIFREACRQARSWIEIGLPSLHLSVNISARQFREPGLCRMIEDIVRETGVPPERMELELTESMLMSDPADAVETMRTMKDLGLAVSLDDFGTGYSSLNYLRRFPVDCLKIDRSFVVDAEQDANGATMIASIVAIAHSLGMTAIAEGVETAEQLHLLARCQCDAIQGYFFSKPLPADDFVRLVREGKTLPSCDVRGAIRSA